ncbi:MAG: hypothetical protein MRZ90_02985 [Candidatus Gastranaerophilales bacterium]|nr:hypothetical protein [Candidatus Gastranaerophilales bacterium]
MKLIQKLKQFEKQVVFIRWGGESEYGKIKYVGSDYLELQVLDINLMEYVETVFINSQLILEVVIGGTDVSRVIAEFSNTLPPCEQR